MFLGFDEESKAYRLYDDTRKKIIISRDVVFDEERVGYQYLHYGEPESNILQTIATGNQDSNGNRNEESQQRPEPNFLEVEFDEGRLETLEPTGIDHLEPST